jgi:hypothetical protein
MACDTRHTFAPITRKSQLIRSVFEREVASLAQILGIMQVETLEARNIGTRKAVPCGARKAWIPLEGYTQLDQRSEIRKRGRG